jgi:uncharacterized membrane protein (UPF0127 family)
MYQNRHQNPTSCKTCHTRGHDEAAWQYVFVFILSIALTLPLIACNPGQSAHTPPEFDRHAMVTIIDGDDGERAKTHSFTVEVAESSDQLSYGLMNRTKLAADKGMLFIFDPAQPVGFWMKNTLIPLDMVFISPDSRVIKVHHMAKPEDETLIPSEGPVAYVLEIKGGQAKKRGIKAGDQLRVAFSDK